MVALSRFQLTKTNSSALKKAAWVGKADIEDSITMDLRKSAGAPTLISEAPVLADVLLVTHRIESGSASTQS